jgi:hypothetical protein
MAGGRGYRVNLTPLAPSQTPGRSPLNLYYDPEHPLWHKRPDWMLSVGVPWLYGGQDLRLSYVTWQERQRAVRVSVPKGIAWRLS